ncbi:hypothetical protein BN2475_700086 [Paraburkholderia ribeironis]|uniref:Uncharacterized protein n=1 Tax=Paraburkholderia ribeironis TaxID=1247936 RepID=A0A1N7SJ14_9BURK|nr:hypothetical protein BN2475_700086 [Paraburkholderia ribeironis]
MLLGDILPTQSCASVTLRCLNFARYRICTRVSTEGLRARCATHARQCTSVRINLTLPCLSHTDTDACVDWHAPRDALFLADGFIPPRSRVHTAGCFLRPPALPIGLATATTTRLTDAEQKRHSLRRIPGEF